jgi:hypothetical protein
MFYLLGMDILITIHKWILPEEIKFFNPHGELIRPPRAWGLEPGEVLLKSLLI